MSRARRLGAGLLGGLAIALLTLAPARAADGAEDAPIVELLLPVDRDLETREETSALVVQGPHGGLRVTSPDGTLQLGRGEGSSIAIRAETRAIAIQLLGEGLAFSAETKTGAIELRVSPESTLDIELATSGEITVDYSIEIDYRYHEEPAKKGRILIGGGQHRVHLTSRRGCIDVLRDVIATEGDLDSRGESHAKDHAETY